jgi:outer membrane lipoprotein SlyB
MNSAKLPRKHCIVPGLLVLLAATAGCQSHPSNLPVYSASEANQLRTSQMGTVDSVRAVIIQGDEGVKTSIGQSVGGSLGRSVAMGGNPVTAVAGAAGSVVGQIAGGAVQKNVASTEGQEITVALDDGTTVVIVQKNNPAYVGGERVKLVGSGSKVTVMPLDPRTSR